MSVRLLAAALALAACSDLPEPKAPSAAVGATDAGPPPEYPSDDAAWGRFHSRRFQLSVPLPDGRAWKIDDHRAPELVATHPPTGSRLVLLATQEADLMNRQRCEERARALGWVPPSVGKRKVELSTVEDQVWVGPDAYDSRLWTALEIGGGDRSPAAAVVGHVYLFGSFLRRCLLVHLTTTVPTSKDENVLAARLAVANARLFKAIKLDPPRTTIEATVPREKPDIRR